MPEPKIFQQPSEKGYYGEFGGAFIPEMLFSNVEQLRTRYLEIIKEPGFIKEFEFAVEGLCRQADSFIFCRQT